MKVPQSQAGAPALPPIDPRFLHMAAAMMAQEQEQQKLKPVKSQKQKADR